MMRLARLLILVSVLAAPLLAGPAPAGALALAPAVHTGGIGDSCVASGENEHASAPVGALSWDASTSAGSGSARMTFAETSADGALTSITGSGDAIGGGAPLNACSGAAIYSATFTIYDPTPITLTGTATWSDGYANGAAVYLHRYASLEKLAEIDGLGSFNVGVPLVLEGTFVLEAVASEPGNIGGLAHYDFTLSFAESPTLTIGDAAGAEGNAGTAALTFPVTLSAPSLASVTVNYRAVDGTAHATDGDYTPASGTLTFAPGETRHDIEVQVVGDTDIESDEFLLVDLSDPAGAAIAKAEAIGTILNDDLGLDFDWTVPDRYDGRDHDGDGLADYFAPDGPLDATPSRWRVDFTYTVAGACDASLTPTWRVDGAEVPAGDPGVIRNDAGACAFSYGFPDEGQYTVALELRDARGNLVGTQQHDVTVQDWLIVSIGDSVAAGEGNPDIPGGGAARWEDGQCHRSATAGPAQAALAIEQADPKTSVTFIHLACSGATIFKGLLGSYGGVVPGSPLPPQLQALQAFVGDREVDALLVSIGANDVHFGDIVQSCLLLPRCDSPTRGVAARAFARDIRRLPSAYNQLATALDVLPLATPLDPERVYLTEYFDPTHGDDGSICADSILADIPVLPRLGFSITAAEATWASETMLAGLNAAVATAAAGHGWNDVGGLAAAFQTHGYCANDHWVVRFSESQARQGDQNGTLHPNAGGQAAYGDRLAAALDAAFYPSGDLSQPRPPAEPGP